MVSHFGVYNHPKEEQAPSVYIDRMYTLILWVCKVSHWYVSWYCHGAVVLWRWMRANLIPKTDLGK